MKTLEQLAQVKAAALKRVFPSMEANLLASLSLELVPETFPKNHYIYREGHDCDGCFILREG